MASLLDMWQQEIPVIDGSKKGEPSSAPTTIIIQNVLDKEQMQFAGSLIKHLNLLYNQMLGEQDMGAMMAPPMQQTRSWYNQGHSSVTESA